MQNLAHSTVAKNRQESITPVTASAPQAFGRGGRSPPWSRRCDCYVCIVKRAMPKLNTFILAATT